MEYGNQNGKKIFAAAMLIALFSSVGAQAGLRRRAPVAPVAPKGMVGRVQAQATRFVGSIRRGVTSRPTMSVIAAAVASGTLAAAVKYKGYWPFNQPAEEGAEASWFRHPYAWSKAKTAPARAKIADRAERAYRWVRPESVRAEGEEVAQSRIIGWFTAPVIAAGNLAKRAYTGTKTRVGNGWAKVRSWVQRTTAVERAAARVAAAERAVEDAEIAATDAGIAATDAGIAAVDVAIAETEAASARAAEFLRAIAEAAAAAESEEQEESDSEEAESDSDSDEEEPAAAAQAAVQINL